MSWGLLTRAWSGWRRVIGFGEQGRALGGARVLESVGGAVSLGLVSRAWSGRRRVLGIADQGVVWVALCHWDC